MEKGVWVVKIVYRDDGDVFYGITGVEKWCWWVKGIEEGGVECLPFWLQASFLKAVTCFFWVWAIRNLWLWAPLSMSVFQESRKRSKLFTYIP